MKPPDDHNARRWLKAVCLDETPRARFKPWPAGWYVIRTCPCCEGERVTEVLPGYGNAVSALEAMLQVSAERGEVVE